jgi:hypothetical protein
MNKRVRSNTYNMFEKSGISDIVTCRAIARERVDEHVSVEMDSWKATHYGTTFPWILVIDKHFLGCETEPQ